VNKKSNDGSFEATLRFNEDGEFETLEGEVLSLTINEDFSI